MKFLNYCKTSHSFFLRLLLILGATLPFIPRANAASLTPSTSQAWDTYIASATARMERRVSPGKNFLWVDENPERLAKVRSGEIVVAPVGEQNPKRIPSGLIHDWIGAAFMEHATITDVLGVVRDYPHYKDVYEPNVLDPKLISSGDTEDRFSMLLVNKAVLLKTAFDADYDVCYFRVDATHLYSISRTTRVQEVDEYGAPGQHLLNAGEGSGLIWNLVGIARYVERDGGVYVELEAIGLSRDIPAGLRWIVDPLVRRISRRAVVSSIDSTRKAVCERSAHPQATTTASIRTSH